MIIRVFMMLVFCGSACIAAPGPKPVLVVLEQNPWLTVIGSDSPKFALYDDGTLIYLRDRPTPDQPFVTRKISDSNALQKELVLFDASKVADRYELSSLTDQISTLIWTPAQSVRIYGDWRKPRALGFGSNPEMKLASLQEKKMWESLPDEIRQTLARIEEQRKINGSAWLPEKIEVMFWPYAYAPEEAIPWPKDWPSLDAKDTRKRGEDSFSVFLPAIKLAELRQLLGNQKQKGAVLVDGKKMAQSYRFPFPGEEMWKKSSDQSSQ
jgi:hypothetical protein